jgi:hypothetical protein
MNDLNGYELSHQWFDFSFENPDVIKPTHTALYFFIIEHCNRLGWKQKFGLPRQMAMDAIGIKNHRTFSKTFDDLVNWGFVEVHEKSKNQYSANVIAIVKNTKAHTKALTKATHKHIQKQSMGIVCIDKLYNKDITNNKETEKQESLPVENTLTYHEQMAEYARKYGAMDGLTSSEIEASITKRGSDDWEKPHGSTLKRITQTNIRHDMLHHKRNGWLKREVQTETTYDAGAMN